MGQLIVSEFVTLDGVMQAPGGPEEDTEGGFKHGGWQMPLLDEESLSLITRDIGRMDALLLGRKTYDIFAAYWPRARATRRSRTNSITHPSSWPPAAAADSNGTIPPSSKETFPRRWPASSKSTAKST